MLQKEALSMRTGKARLIWLAAGLFILFAAFIGCGGGDDGPSPPVIDTASPLPSGTVGTAYSQTIAVSGGTSPHSWSVTSGALPAGLTLSTEGILSGTPTTVDNSSFTVQATGGGTATKSFSLVVNAGPEMIRLEGGKQLVLLDNYDNTVRYRAAVRLLDAAGNVLTDSTALKGMKIYDPSGVALATDNNFIFWNGANFSIDNITAITPTPMSEIEMYLTATPGTLSPGFYTASITDNTGNIYTSSLWFQTPGQVGEPIGLSQVKNPDNSITLSWTNQTGPLPAPVYYLAIIIVCNDTNGDGLDDLLLYAGRGNPQTFYTIPAAFVQSTLVGKTGLRWYVEIRQQTAAPVTFPDNTSSNPLIYRNRSVQVPLTL
jgi:Putative Ig domain